MLDHFTKNPQFVVMVPFARLLVMSLGHPGMLGRWCMPQYVTRFVHGCGKRSSRVLRWSTLPGRAWVGIRMEYENTSPANKTQEERQTEAEHRGSRQSQCVGRASRHIGVCSSRRVHAWFQSRHTAVSDARVMLAQSAQRHARLPLTCCRQSRPLKRCLSFGVYQHTVAFLRNESQTQVLSRCDVNHSCLVEQG